MKTVPVHNDDFVTWNKSPAHRPEPAPFHVHAAASPSSFITSINLACKPSVITHPFVWSRNRKCSLIAHHAYLFSFSASRGYIYHYQGVASPKVYGLARLGKSPYIAHGRCGPKDGVRRASYLKVFNSGLAWLSEICTTYLISISFHGISQWWDGVLKWWDMVQWWDAVCADDAYDEW